MTSAVDAHVNQQRVVRRNVRDVVGGAVERCHAGASAERKRGHSRRRGRCHSTQHGAARIRADGYSYGTDGHAFPPPPQPTSAWSPNAATPRQCRFCSGFRGARARVRRCRRSTGSRRTARPRYAWWEPDHLNTRNSCTVLILRVRHRVAM